MTVASPGLFEGLIVLVIIGWLLIRVQLLEARVKKLEEVGR